MKRGGGEGPEIPHFIDEKFLSPFLSSPPYNALFIYLIILVEFRIFYMTYMIYVDK